MIKDNTNLFKTAHRNNGEKLPLCTLTGSSVTHPRSLPSQFSITSNPKFCETNGIVPKQDRGLEGTVTDELFQVFHIERPVLLEVSDVGRPVEPAEDGAEGQLTPHRQHLVFQISDNIIHQLPVMLKNLWNI